MFSWLFGDAQGSGSNTSSTEAELNRTEFTADDHVSELTTDERDLPEGVATGKLFKYAEDSEQYLLVIKDALINISEDPNNAFSSSVVVYDSIGNKQFSQPLDHGMQINFSAKEHSMVWLLTIGDELDGEIVSLRFVFDDPVVEDEFKLNVARNLFESSRKESFQKTVKLQDQDWVLRSHAHVNEDEDPEDPMEISSSGETDSESDDDTPSTPVKGAGKSEAGKNSHLTMGMNTDRMFVVRGSDIGVFKHGRGDIKHIGTLENVKANDGTIFSPSKVMLHDRERKMLMLRPDQENKVIELDLETRQIVQEYQAEDDVLIRDLGPHSRFSQMEGTELITGLNKNSVFTMDPRVNSKNKKVKGFSYAANPNLSCIAANGKAQYVLGSDKGEIRMFSDIGKRAKTLLPGLGHAVTAVDTSGDGRWVLATTDRYIMLIPTETNDGRTGFDVSMGKQKPDLIKLQMKAEDIVKYKIKDVRFRKATFDLGPNNKEQFIVSAIGHLLLTWTLRGVVRGRTMDYTVRAYEQNVVADQFRYGYKDVVVTLPDEIKRARFTQ